jgi:predicted permease
VIPLISAFIPIWLLTSLGYLAARLRLAGGDPGEAEAVLGRFVFRLAMPAALFGTLARTDLHALANLSIVAFGISTVVAYAAGMLVDRYAFRRPAGEQAIAGMAAGHVNSANLGLPVMTQVLGNGSFVTTVILFQTVVITPILLTMLDSATGGERRSHLRDAVTLPVRNPIIIASALGALCSAFHWHVPADLSRSLALLGGAAVPVALIALGMSLYGRRAQGGARRAETAAVIALKVVMQPLLAYTLAAFVLGLGPRDVLAVTLCAALPTAQNAFIFAREYGLPTALARDSVVFSTLASLVTLSLVVVLLN